HLVQEVRKIFPKRRVNERVLHQFQIRQVELRGCVRRKVVCQKVGGRVGAAEYSFEETIMWVWQLWQGASLKFARKAGHLIKECLSCQHELRDTWIAPGRIA